MHGGASETIKQYKCTTVDWAWLLCSRTMMRHIALLIRCTCCHTQERGRVHKYTRDVDGDSVTVPRCMLSGYRLAAADSVLTRGCLSVTG